MVATVALLSWPLVTFLLFGVLGREKGLIWSVVIGYLFLPEDFSFDLAGLPPYGKVAAISLGLALGALVFRNKSSHAAHLQSEVGDDHRLFRTILMLLVATLLVGSVMTVQGNGRALIDADRVRQGLSMRDAVSTLSDAVIVMFPFLLAWRWLRTPEDHAEALRAIVVLAIFYTLLALFEMRMSPQLNRMVYGYFPHSWLQHIRGGSFRPLVFLQHGLWLAFFLLMAACAAFGLFRQERSQMRLAYLAAGLWILAVLFITPNLGAAMLALLFVPIILFTSVSLQARVTAIVAVVFLAYPSVRVHGLLPLDSFLQAVNGISGERAQSLSVRLENEDRLLARAAEKPIFGWGGWGRARVIDEKGRDITITDGLWIIILGARGWVGYIAYFGVLVLPLLMMGRAGRKKPLPETTAAMGLIMAANLVYIIPNSALNPIGWLLAGAVGGFVSLGNREIEPASPANTPREGARYTRFVPSHGKAAPSFRRN